jgi:hypothetical protein
VGDREVVEVDNGLREIEGETADDLVSEMR